MTNDISISVKNVSKKFRLFNSPKERLAEALHPFRKQYHKTFWALQEVSFNVHRGEIVGILGRNGSGKSTLLQIICSVMQATQGEVQVNGRISALLELGAGFNPEFTGRENVLLNGSIMGIARKEMLSRIPEIEAFADIGEFFDQPVKTYSSGMYVRVAFAAAIHVDPDILIVDEALSVGDIKFQEKCFRKISEFQRNGVTIILVTHATTLIEELCDRAIVIDAGKVRYIGEAQSAVSEYEGILFPRKAIVETMNGGLLISEGAVTELHTSKPGDSTITDGGNIGFDPKGPLLRKFLDEFPLSDQSQYRRSYNNSELRFGDGGGEIIDYLVIACGEEDPVSIQFGSEVSVYIKVLGKSTINNPSIGVGIFTATGLMVCSGNARLLNKKLSRIENGKYYLYKMSFLSLMSEGDYFFHFGLTEVVYGEIVRHDARRSIANFRVPITPHIEGVADLSMKLEELVINN